MLSTAALARRGIIVMESSLGRYHALHCACLVQEDVAAVLDHLACHRLEGGIAALRIAS